MPRPVDLAPHDPRWAAAAAAEIARVTAAAPGVWLSVRHVGSTAVPGLVAKPVLDLIAEAGTLEALDQARPALEALGYAWRGENGVAGRRYCTLDDPETGTRRVHLHCHAARDPAVARAVAFRDALRARPVLAAGYAAEKRRCATLHPQDSGAYAACKAGWIGRVLAEV